MQLTPVRTDSETVAVLGAQWLSWHRVTLPRGTLGRAGARKGSRLRAVLEGLLEEQLLEDASTVHIALPPQAREGQPLWVAVCAREALAQAVQGLRAQGHGVQRLVPEYTPGLTDDSATPLLWVCGTADAAQLQWADESGVHCWPLAARRQGASVPPGAQAALQAGALVRAEPAVAHCAQEWFGPDVHVQTPQERLALAARSPWDLAQAELALQTPWPQRLLQTAQGLWQAKAWAPARWALGLVLLVQLLGVNALAWRARHDEQALQQALVRTLTSTFPQTPVVVDAPAQMERAVAQLRQNSGAPGAQDFDMLLQSLQQNWPSPLDSKGFDAIEFEANELRVNGVTLAPEALQAWQQTLRAQGLELQAQGSQLRLSAGVRP